MINQKLNIIWNYSTIDKNKSKKQCLEEFEDAKADLSLIEVMKPKI